MSRCELDGVVVKNTPDSIRWEPPTLLGINGTGEPVYAPYWSATISFARTSVVQLQHWYDAMDGDTHTVRLPHPITGRWTEFSSVYIRLPGENLNTRDVARPSSAGVDFRITRVSVS